jgi:HTH-type transcriptional regulator/antitoxin HigA
MTDQPSIAPIASDADLDRATAEIGELLMLDRDGAQEARLDALTDAVEAYEDEHYPMPPVSDAEMLRHLIEARGSSVGHVAASTGIDPARLEDVLAGRTPVGGLAVILGRYFHVSPAVFDGATGKGGER